MSLPPAIAVWLLSLVCLPCVGVRGAPIKPFTLSQACRRHPYASQEEPVPADSRLSRFCHEAFSRAFVALGHPAYELSPNGCRAFLQGLGEGFDPNVRFRDRQGKLTTLLHVHIRKAMSTFSPEHEYWYRGILVWLMRHGADPNRHADYMPTPLGWVFVCSSSREPSLPRRLGLVQSLLEAGAQVEADTCIALGGESMTPLMLACLLGGYQEVKCLVAYGACVNAQARPAGYTPLIWATQRISAIEPWFNPKLYMGRLNKAQGAIISFLWQEGADSAGVDGRGMTPMMHALLRGRRPAQRFISFRGHYQGRTAFDPWLCDQLYAQGFPLCPSHARWDAQAQAMWMYFYAVSRSDLAITSYLLRRLNDGQERHREQEACGESLRQELEREGLALSEELLALIKSYLSLRFCPYSQELQAFLIACREPDRGWSAGLLAWMLPG